MTAGLTSTPGGRSRCRCVPCLTPQHGAPGWAHCAACCYGSGVEEYDHECPVGDHAEMAEMQNPARRAVAPAAAAFRESLAAAEAAAPHLRKDPR